MTLLLIALQGVVPVINEIHFAPGNPALEFVELYNPGPDPVDLQPWTLRDSGSAGASVAPRGVRLQPGAFVPLVRDGAAFSARWPGVAFLQVSPWPTLNDTGDVVTVEGPAGEDSVPYSPAWGAAGRSLERRDPAGPSWHVVNWGPSLDVTGASPGLVNSIHARDRDAPLLTFADRLTPDTVTVWFSEPIGHAIFRLGGSFVDPGPVPAGALRVAIPVDPTRSVDRVAAIDLEDLFGNRTAESAIEVASEATPRTLRLSEVLAAARTDPFDGLPDQVPFVELVSVHSGPVSLRGVFLAARATESGSARSTLPLSGPLGLAPGGRAVLFDARFARSQTDARAVFSAAFGDPGDAPLVPLDDWPIGQTTAPIRVMSPRSGEVDEFRGHGGWYDGPDDGRSLERIRPEDEAAGPSRWAASEDPGGATPGRPNSVGSYGPARLPEPGDLVLSEVLYEADAGGNPTRPEFVELLVLAPFPIDPNGLSLRVGPVSGAADSVRIAWSAEPWPPGAVSVASGQSSTPKDRLSDLRHSYPSSPIERVLPLRTPLRNGEGEIVLISGSGAILDRVTYRDSMHHSGLLATRGVSLERIDPLGPGTEPTNWRSSVHPDGATPGVVPTPPPPRPNSTGRLLDLEPAVIHPDESGLPSSVAIRIRTFAGPGLVNADVYDLSGRLVRRLTQGQPIHDELTLYWDGRGDEAAPLPAGPYVVAILVADVDGRLARGRGVVVVARR